MKMFHRFWFCLCFWRLVGVFGETYVKIGHSVTLNSGLSEMMDNDLIRWECEYGLIAEINVTADRFSVYDDVPDGIFRDRLKLDNQTGSLTITNITTEHTGYYEVETKTVSESFWLRVYDEISVKEGDSVTLNYDRTEIDYDLIRWEFENSLIAKIYEWDDRPSVYDDVLDGRFRDRLKLDKQTGSLTITNISTEHAGRYELVIDRRSRMRKTFFLNAVNEEISVKKGGSVTLNSDLTEIMNNVSIKWRFGDEITLLAEISRRVDGFSVYDDVLDGRFRDRLKLDNQTGSLTITNITTEHAGDYIVYNNTMSKIFWLSVYEEISVKEGDSVTLNSGFTEIDYYWIRWSFEYSLIAKINKWDDGFSVYDDVPDGRFRDRLKLDNQTGSLTITNTRTEHAGRYELVIDRRMRSRMRKTFFLSAVNEEISVKKGDSVTLNSDLTEIMNNVSIKWRFGAEITLLAEISRLTNGFSVYDDVLDGRFRDRLKLNNQTGSLTITNITTEHAGRYLLHLGPKHLNLNQSLKAFSVSVSDSVHCCGSTEAVMRLVLSALVGVATVILLVYDIRSRRAEQDQTQIHTSGACS